MLISDEHLETITNTVVALGAYDVTVSQSAGSDVAVLTLWPGTGKVRFHVVE